MGHNSIHHATPLKHDHVLGNKMNEGDDSFELYDLKIEVVGKPDQMVCSHRVGDYFVVRGENIFLPEQQGFSLYALSALLPLIPAKQRDTHENDWMSTDDFVACPDPNCGARFRISRIGRRNFKHSDVTATSLYKKPDGTE